MKTAEELAAEKAAEKTKETAIDALFKVVKSDIAYREALQVWEPVRLGLVQEYVPEDYRGALPAILGTWKPDTGPQMETELARLQTPWKKGEALLVSENVWEREDGKRVSVTHSNTFDFVKFGRKFLTLRSRVGNTGKLVGAEMVFDVLKNEQAGDYTGLSRRIELVDYLRFRHWMKSQGKR